MMSIVMALGLLAAACSSTDGDASTNAAPSVDDSREETTPGSIEAEPDAELAEPESADSDIPATTASPEDQDNSSVGEDTVVIGRSITVSLLDDETADLIEALTPEHFTARTGIEVVFQPDPVDCAVGGGIPEIPRRPRCPDWWPGDARPFDSFFAAQFGENGWLVDLTENEAFQAAADVDDIVPSVRELLSYDGSLFAAPIRVESTLLMANQELLDANNIALSTNPTWNEVAEAARSLHSDDVAGICLNALAGWHDLSASLTPVINSFGGTWWEAIEDPTRDSDVLVPGEPQVNQPGSGFREATELFVDLLRDAGPSDRAALDDAACLELFGNGRVALWLGPSSAARDVEAASSAVAGSVSYRLAPVAVTGSGGGLNAWSLAIPTDALEPDAAAEFIAWVSSAEFIDLASDVASDEWNAATAGYRLSAFEEDRFRERIEPFGDVLLESLLDAAPLNPGTTPRPGLPGVEVVGVPEFQDIATRCSQEIAAAINDQITTDDALDRCQDIASEISQAPVEG